MNLIHFYLILGALGLITFIASAIYFHKREKAE